MDNYYGDKYNLDNYYTSEKPNRKKGRKYGQSNRKASKSKTNKKENKVKATGKNSPKKKGGTRFSDKKKSNARKSKAFYFVPVALLLIVFSVTVGIVIWNNQDDTFRFSKNVSVSGIDISGLTQKEAKAKITENAVDTVEDFAINVSVKGKNQTFTQNDFTYKFDVKCNKEYKTRRNLSWQQIQCKENQEIHFY